MFKVIYSATGRTHDGQVFTRREAVATLRRDTGAQLIRYWNLQGKRTGATHEIISITPYRGDLNAMTFVGNYPYARLPDSEATEEIPHVAEQ